MIRIPRRVLAAVGATLGAVALVAGGITAASAAGGATMSDGYYSCTFTTGVACDPATIPTVTETATVTATATTTVTATPTTKLLVGESFGGSSAANVNSSEAAFPEQTVGRYYFSGDPATIENTPGLAAIPQGETVWLSFKTAYGTVTGGAWDSTFQSILDDYRASGRTVYWTWEHEPENNGLTTAQYVAGWNHLLSLANGHEGTTVHSMTVLMAQDLSDGSAESWYVSGVDVLGFDDYSLARESDAIAYAKSKGKPLTFPEIGDGTTTTTTDAHSLAFLQSFVAGLDPVVMGFAWFNGNNNALASRPQTLAYLRTLP